jgi:hypothetical protein
MDWNHHDFPGNFSHQPVDFFLQTASFLARFLPYFLVLIHYTAG